MTRSTLRLSAIPCAVLLLAACGDDQGARDASGDSRTAAGEVRGGTISDAMLPLDTVRSQNPPRAASSNGGAGSSSTDPAATGNEGGESGADDPDAAIDALADDLADDAAAAAGDYEL